MSVPRTLALGLCLAGAACASAVGTATPAVTPAAEARAEVEATLDRFHRAASEADAETYFGLFAPGGVFLGTDATERWTVDEFRAYAKPYFDRGQGWTYVPIERHVAVAENGEVAWFDERLRNEGLGETRGSGVLVRRGGGWKVAQYNLTIPVPNELAGEFAARIRALEAAADSTP